MERRETFDSDALDYDAVRPGYPDALIEDVIQLSGLPDGGSILEIGCGTGQATDPFAQRGYSMVCLDIGENMLAVARDKLQGRNVEFVCAAFEDWDANRRTFDLVMSATAFHWIPVNVRCRMSAERLLDGGSLAVIRHLHPQPLTGFFLRVQSIYRRVTPEWPDPRTGPSDYERVQQAEAEFAASGLFELAETRRYRWDEDYTTEQYLRLLNTYSDHRSLPDERRAELFDGIAALIKAEFDGRVTRPCLAMLHIAKKRA